MIDVTPLFLHGRTYLQEGNLYLYNTASGIEFNFRGKMAILTVKAEIGQQDRCWLRVIIDNDDKNAVDLKFGAQNQEFKLFSSFNEEIHNIKVLKVSEAIESHACISDLVIDGVYLDKPKYDKTFLVFGDSTVSAFGNLGKVDDEKTLDDTDGLAGFAYLTAKHFNASMNSLNGSGWGTIFSFWTTPKRRPLLDYYDKMAPIVDVKYDMKQVNPTIVLISLGTNDASYYTNPEAGEDTPSLIEEFMAGYKKLLANVKRDYPNVPIVMIYGVMKEYVNYQTMHEIYLECKENYNLYEALIEGDNQGVSTHPSLASHKEIASKLIKIVKEIINE